MRKKDVTAWGHEWEYSKEYVEKMEQIASNMVGYFLGFDEDPTVEDIQEWTKNPAVCVFLINNLRDLKSHLDK